MIHVVVVTYVEPAVRNAHDTALTNANFFLSANARDCDDETGTVEFLLLLLPIKHERRTTKEARTSE